MDQGKSLFRSNDVGGEETMLSLLLPGSSLDWSALSRSELPQYNLPLVSGHHQPKRNFIQRISSNKMTNQLENILYQSSTPMRMKTPLFYKNTPK